MKDTKEAPPPRPQRNSVEAAAYTIPTDLVDLPSRGKRSSQSRRCRGSLYDDQGRGRAAKPEFHRKRDCAR